MSIASEIQRLQQAKSSIKQAIEGKGVAVTASARLSDYDSYIEAIDAGGWQPHSDWIDISDVNDNEINLLVSDGGVGIAFAVTVADNGTYSIDWGDGTIETNRASGATYAHQYTIGSGKPVSGGQYTVFKIRIYGATGNITRFKMRRHPNYTRPTYAPLLWAVFGTQYITDYSNTFYTNGHVECRELQACTIPSFASCSSTSDMFYNCHSLSSVTLPSSWGNVMYANSMFQYCYSLSSVTLPSSWGNVMYANSMFQYCFSLRTINNLEYLGSQTNASDFTDFLRDAQAITGTLTIASKLSKIGIYGQSGHNLKCTGIRLTNGTSTWTGSSPQIDVSYCSLDANALNTLFGDLETVTGKTIKITGNPGASTCDTSIATSKGWTVAN